MTENTAANTLARLGDMVSRCFLRRNTLETATWEERNYAEVNRALAGGGKVFFISSFPRSGNTWVRFLLSDIFLQRAGRATGTVLPVHPDRVIPDIYCNLVSEVERGITPGVFVKTHEGFDRLKKRIPPAELRRCRHVYIIRSPEDALISFYRYHLREENLKHKVRQGMDSFCRARVRDWVANAASYARAAEDGAEVYFVSYEKLFDQTGPVLNGMLDWLGVEHQDGMVRRAVSNMQFDNMRREEERGKVNGNEVAARGGPGAGAAELEAGTLAAIHEAAAEVMTRVKWHLSRQNEASGNGA
ncbi:MAG: sulfotransferase domain-containing protein [Verrucomicrobiota bacterium]